jgi:hypothetical protein
MSRWIRAVNGGVVARGARDTKDTYIVTHPKIEKYCGNPEIEKYCRTSNNVSICAPFCPTDHVDTVMMPIVTGNNDPVWLQVADIGMPHGMWMNILNESCCLLKFSYSCDIYTFVLKTPSREIRSTVSDWEHGFYCSYSAQDVHDTSRTYLHVSTSYSPPWRDWVADFAKLVDMTSDDQYDSRRESGISMAVSERSHDSVYGHMSDLSVRHVIVQADIRDKKTQIVFEMPPGRRMWSRWQMRNLYGQIYAVDMVDRIVSIFDERAYAMVGTDILMLHRGDVLFCTFEIGKSRENVALDSGRQRRHCVARHLRV